MKQQQASSGATETQVEQLMEEKNHLQSELESATQQVKVHVTFGVTE